MQKSSKTVIDIFCSFLDHFGSFGSFFYGMALIREDGDLLALKIIHKITEIKVCFASLIKLSMTFGPL
jgi:hypothetical protein